MEERRRVEMEEEFKVPWARKDVGEWAAGGRFVADA